MKKSIFLFLFLVTLLPFCKGEQVVNGLIFDGTNDYVSLGNSSSLKSTDNLTIELWLKMNSWNNTDTQYIITSSDTLGYFLRLVNGTLEGGVFRNDSFGIVSYGVSSFSGWHHIGLVYDGEFVYLYVDAISRDSNDALNIAYIQYDDSPVILGANNSATAKFLNGTIDELRIWSSTRVISLTTIISEVSPASSGLSAYYRCNQGIAGDDNSSITSLTDLTGNGNDGNFNNFALSGSTSNFVAGKALRPANQATNVTFSTRQLNSLTFSWTRPGSNMGGNGVKAFMKATTTGTAAPTDGTDYTANSSFSSGAQIGSSGWYCVYDGTGTSTTVTNLTAGTAYRVHVIEYQRASGDQIRYLSTSASNNPNYTYTVFATPSTQASNINFTNLAGTSFQINWTRGNGSNCIVFVSNTTEGTAQPVNNTSYTANTTFGMGSQAGSGWYCVYNGTGTSVTVSGLTVGNTYRAMVLEYNGIAGYESYNTTSNTGNPNNQEAVFSTPTTQASNIVFSNVNENSFSVSWTSGNGSHSAVFIKQGNSGTASPSDNTTYAANSDFGMGTEIGSSGWYCIYNGTGTSVNVTGLTVGNTYRVMVCSYNGISGFEKYNITSASNNPLNQMADFQKPTTQASQIVADNTTSYSVNLTWTAGNGSSRAVFIAEGQTGTPAPVDNTTYSANSAFKEGSQIGSTGWYCVYNGNGNSINVNNLTAHTYYRIMVCEYNGTTGLEKYLTTTTTNNPLNFQTDFAAPGTQASNIVISDYTADASSIYITRGDGENVAIFVAQTTSGTASPSNNTHYNANSAFGSGDQIGSSGWYCVYNGTDNYVYITNLQPGTDYRIMACEYNGTSGSEKYNINTATNNPVNFTTEFEAPTIQSSTINFSGITSNSATATWTRGNGQYCAAFIYFGSSGTALPEDDITYTGNTNYGIGTQIGGTGWYCVYSGTGNSVNITGLASQQTYRLMVVEFNNLPGHEKYYSDVSTNNPANFTTLFSGPSTQAKNINFTGTGSDYLSLNWTRGNGSACAVFAKVGTSGSALPVDGQTYTANSAFGSGSQIGTSGWYCIYNGTGTSTTLNGLSSNTSYIIMVTEYLGTAGNEKYNTNSATNNPRSQSTDFTTPSIQANNVQFANVTYNSFTVNWTNGNGSYRVVFVKEGSDGTAAPVNNTTYTANTVFKSGTQIGTTGWYCVYNGSGSSVSVSGLSSLTSYQVMVCEYNGTSGKQKYNITESTGNPATKSTIAPSSITQAQNISFSNISNTSFSINWTRGNGSACAVFVKNTGSGTPVPENGITYTANPAFGSGSQIGSSGWYCVYNGTGNSVNVSSLTSAIIYKVMVCEYIGSAGNEQYAINTTTNNPASQCTSPYTIWNGSSWSNGNPDANTAAIIAANLSSSGNLICKTLLINNNISFNVQPGNSLTVYNDLVNNGTLKLVSPSTMNPSGSLITYGNIYNNKTMSAERFITEGTLDASNYIWHFLCSPVEAFTVEKSFTGDYVYKLEESTNSWVTLKTGDFISPAIGYMVKTIKTGGKTITYSGTFNSGSYSVSLTNTGGTADNGYNLVGNPYPSAINWNASSGWSKTNISNTIWIWNPSVNNYATWNGYVGVNGGSSSIPAMQGFFVKVNEGSSSGSLSMNNNVRIHSSQNLLKRKSESNLELIRFIALDKHNNSDEMVVYKANPENSSEKLYSMDANMPQIFTRKDTRSYAIYAIDNISGQNNISIGYLLPDSGSYQLKISEFSFDTASYTAYMINTKNGQSLAVSNSKQYNFSTETKDTLWLDLYIVSKSNSIITQPNQSEKISVWSSKNRVFVDLPDDDKTFVEVFNMLGSKIAEYNFYSRGINRFEIQENGIFLVKVTSTHEQFVTKLFIKK
jgi:hypothetical protein